MKTLELTGTHRQIGRAHGEACRDDIHRLYARRIENAVTQAFTYGGRTIDEAGLLALCERCMPMVEAFHPPGWQELSGIAEGAGLGITQVWAMNALTDLRDLAAFGDVAAPDGLGCSSFVVQGDLAAGRRFCGQTWDLATDNMPYVLMIRRRAEGEPETLCLTTTGCLSLIGMNGHGLAVGTTNVRAYDARLGVSYLDVIHKALTQSTAAEAAAVIGTARRAGAHYYYALDRAGEALALECTATLHETVAVDSGAYVHCNHFLSETLRAHEVAGTPIASSMRRQGRLTSLLTTADRPLTPEDLRASLGDTDGGVNAVSRHDFNGISSNGAVVMEPAQLQLWAVHGPPDQGEWQAMSIAGEGGLSA